jgi:hypothetical protein
MTHSLCEDLTIFADGELSTELKAKTTMKLFAIGSRFWPGISKLIEECSEVVAVCGKLLGISDENVLQLPVIKYWDGTDLIERLTNELGDLVAAIEFILLHCPIDRNHVADRAQKKLLLFEQWHKSDNK